MIVTKVFTFSQIPEGSRLSSPPQVDPALSHLRPLFQSCSPGHKCRKVVLKNVHLFNLHPALLVPAPLELCVLRNVLDVHGVLVELVVVVVLVLQLTLRLRDRDTDRMTWQLKTYKVSTGWVCCNIQDLIVGDLVILVLDESVRIEAKLKFKL